LLEVIKTAVCLKCGQRLEGEGIIKHIKAHLYEIIEEKVTPEWIKAVNSFFNYLEKRGLL